MYPTSLAEDRKPIRLKTAHKRRALLVPAVRFCHDGSVHDHQYSADDRALGVTLCSPAAAATADKAVNAIARSGIARMNASGHVHLPDRMQA